MDAVTDHDGAALAFDQVVKRFGTFTALDDLSFEVPRGVVFGYLGGNGAGKTTSIRMALDILRPTGGRIEVLGRPPGRSLAPLIGFLPEERGLYRKMKVEDVLAYFGRLRGMAAGAAKRSAGDLLARFDLTGWASAKVEKLSKGMAQKVQLAAALINSPRLLLLDEPFAGLDPVNQGVLETMVLEFARSGATVIFSTHVMQHAERLCDRLLLLSRGRKVFEGSLAQARAMIPPRLTLTAKDDPSGLPLVARAEKGEERTPGWFDWKVTLGAKTDAGDLLAACTSGGFALRGFDEREPSLHEVFLHLVGGEAEAAQ